MESSIYLVRHGAVDMPVPRRFLGQTDVRLNDVGRHQARTLAQGLAPVRFARVVASPLQRAVETAVLISGRQSGQIEVVAAFKEIHLGEWEGLSVAEIGQRFPGEYEQRGQALADFRPRGGESFTDLADRCWPAFLDLIRGQPRGPLLIVAHAGVNRVLLSRLLGRPLQQVLAIPQEHCGVNIMTKTPQGLRVVGINLHPGAVALPPNPDHSKAMNL